MAAQPENHSGGRNPLELEISRACETVLSGSIGLSLTSDNVPGLVAQILAETDVRLAGTGLLTADLGTDAANSRKLLIAAKLIPVPVEGLIRAFVYLRSEVEEVVDEVYDYNLTPSTLSRRRVFSPDD